MINRPLFKVGRLRTAAADRTADSILRFPLEFTNRKFQKSKLFSKFSSVFSSHSAKLCFIYTKICCLFARSLIHSSGEIYPLNISIIALKNSSYKRKTETLFIFKNYNDINSMYFLSNPFLLFLFYIYHIEYSPFQLIFNTRCK